MSAPKRGAPSLAHWSHRHERAALLVAEDHLTDEEIAHAVHLSQRQLERWKLLPVFQAHVDRLRERLAAESLAGGIADRAQRVAFQQERHRALRQVVAERGADPTMRDIPGGTTGYVVRQLKMIGLGKQAQVVEEHAVDKPTLDALAALEKQTAQELGQWTEKSEVAAKMAVRTTMDLSGVPAEVLDELERLVGAIAESGSNPGGESAPASP